MPLGTAVSLRGVLTTPFGLLDGGRHAYLDDGTGGIALITDFDPPVLPVATDIQVSGTLISSSGELSVEIATPEDAIVLGTGSLPEPLQVATGLACEPFEARLIEVEGTLVADPGQTADGVMTIIDDGSGPLPVLAATSSGIEDADLVDGSRARLIGVLGQVSDEPPICRLILRSTVDVEVLAPPPTPTPTPTSTPTPTPTPTATPRPRPRPRPLQFPHQPRLGHLHRRPRRLRPSRQRRSRMPAASRSEPSFTCQERLPLAWG